MKSDIHGGAQRIMGGTHGKTLIMKYEEALPPEGHRLSSQKKARMA
jgi:hypothetical protein